MIFISLRNTQLRSLP